MGLTKGYKNHPQLIRFLEVDNPELYINSYLLTIYDESVNRGYHFNRSKIGITDSKITLNVNSEQITYEFEHLQSKLAIRDKDLFKKNSLETVIKPNNFFKIVPGEIESWEIL